MDANGTRYYLLLGRQDWANCTQDEKGQVRLGDLWSPSPPVQPDPTLAWVQEKSELTLKHEVFRFPTSSRDVMPGIEKRRGAGRDRHGSWYWIAGNGQEILVRSAGSDAVSRFWSAEEALARRPAPRPGAFMAATPAAAPAALKLQGLAVTEDQYLVAGTLAPAGLLIFDLFAGGAPQELLFPPDVEFAPFDIAPRPGGGVWILDRKQKRVWAFDRLFNVLPCEQSLQTLAPEQVDDFQPLDPTSAEEATRRKRSAVTLPEGIDLNAAPALSLSDPISVEGLPDGSMLILDRDPAAPASTIYHLRFSQEAGHRLSTEAMEAHLSPGATGHHLLQGHDLAFAPVAPKPPADAEGRVLCGRLHVASAEGNQVFVFQVYETSAGLQFEPTPDYLPMRLFSGKAIVAAGNEVFYDLDDRWLALVRQRRSRFVEEGTLYTPIGHGQQVFDSREPDCVWHRLFLDACLSPGAAVAVRTRAANELDALPYAGWQSEPSPYLRASGSELPYVGRQGDYDTWELLFQRARGRYLQVELTLRGNGLASPRVRSLRAYYPRFSYLSHYLPAVYREEQASASFLDRFLANAEGTLTALEDRIAAAEVLFDPSTAPQDALDWLAGWFDVALDPAWDDLRRRLFIRHAMRFFQQRGTLNGLHMALQLAFGDCLGEQMFTTPLDQRHTVSGIRIVEQFRTRRTPGVVLGDPTSEAGLRAVSRAARWRPEEGGAGLQQRYEDYVARNALADVLPAEFALTPPVQTTSASAWEAFAREVLGFVPSTNAANLGRWHAFLGRRYHAVDALNDRYQLIDAGRYASFEAIPLPEALPADGAAQQDWYQFQAVALAMHRTAHHFVVLLPMPSGTSIDEDERRERLALARRVVELEKPAHTTFDVKFFWDMFRVGQARLGYDTLVELGSRSPDLMTPMILGQGHLIESYLASAHVAPEGRSYVRGDFR